MFRCVTTIAIVFALTGVASAAITPKDMPVRTRPVAPVVAQFPHAAPSQTNVAERNYFQAPDMFSGSVIPSTCRFMRNPEFWQELPACQ